VDDEILTPAEYAAYYNVSERTVRRHWRKLGGFLIPGTKILRFRLREFGGGGVEMERVVRRPSDLDPGRHGL
jgi:predicted DNA-binding transcriptional regulator YafY